MKDEELFKLCKEVYEKTGWKDTQRDYYDLVYVNPLSGDASEESRKVQAITVYERQMYYDKNEHMSAIKLCPEYMSDYLMEKLQEDYDITLYNDANSWQAMNKRSQTQCNSDSPLKALLMLVLALSMDKEKV